MTRQIETKTYDIAPTELRLLKDRQNARYMTTEQMKRLTENTRRDGCLTSAVLVFRPTPANKQYYLEGNDRLVVLSGNHRTQAAIGAELSKIPVIEITSSIPDEEAVAIQLSHNAISGQDDLSILLELYEVLPLDEKLYSGLTDDHFKIEEIDLSGMAIGAPAYQEVSLLFLPIEAEEFGELTKRIEKDAKRLQKSQTLVASLADFDRIFEATVKVKTELNVHNTALALRMMADLAMERLAQIEQEGES